MKNNQTNEFSDFIKPICLPVSNDLRTADFDGYDMEVAGWGKTENRKYRYRNSKIY